MASSYRFNLSPMRDAAKSRPRYRPIKKASCSIVRYFFTGEKRTRKIAATMNRVRTAAFISDLFGIALGRIITPYPPLSKLPALADREFTPFTLLLQKPRAPQIQGVQGRSRSILLRVLGHEGDGHHRLSLRAVKITDPLP